MVVAAGMWCGLVQIAHFPTGRVAKPFVGQNCITGDVALIRGRFDKPAKSIGKT